MRKTHRLATNLKLGSKCSLLVPIFLGTSNLLGNVTTLARQSDFCLICVKGAFEIFDTSELVFILFALLRHSKHILAWRKNVKLSLTAQEFIEFVKK